MTDTNRPGLGILFILIGMTAISFNDMLIKQLSGGYPLHQMVFVRSGIGLFFSLILVQLEGGWRILKTNQPGLHVLRGVLVVLSNMTFFAALAAMPLGEATAMFFIAPLLITLLSIPILGEKVGPFRIGAVAVGFIGVLIMQRPWESADSIGVTRFVLLMPLLAALTYALNQVLTRKLGVSSKASALAVYIQLMFILVSAVFYLVAGDGRFAAGVTNESIEFLLRAWIMPEGFDRWLFLALGMNSAIVGYCLSQAYRLASAATIAPFEYIGLPMAIMWGWLIWSDLPVLEVWIGITLIVAAGLFVYLRERKRAAVVQPVVSEKSINRRY